MNDPASSRRTRITTAVVGSAVAAVIAVTAFGAVRAGSAAGDETTPTSAPSATPLVTGTTPTPAPTVSAPISSEAPIRTDLTAEVVSSKSITVKSTQAGEIGGPAVRFTIKVVNTTDKAVSLADTVVNATSGADREPAYGIDSAGKAFPSSVPAGRSVTGVYVFTIPKADRGTVTVTLDTATFNPVVAFTGAAPR